MEFTIYILSTVPLLVSLALCLVMIKKTSGPLVWITIALLISLKIIRNFFSFYGFEFVTSDKWSCIAEKVLPVPINIFLLLVILYLAAIYRHLDNSNKKRVTTNSRLDSIISGMNDFLMEIDRNYRIISVNSRFKNQYSKNGKPLIGQFCYEVTHGETLPCRDINHPCPFKEVFKNAKPVMTEHIHKDSEGKDTIVHLSCFPLFNTEGNVTSMVEIAQDLTIKRETEEKLSIFSKAVEQSPSVVVITDLEGNIEYVNPMFTEITGYSGEDVIGHNPRILKSGETPEDEYKELWNTISSGGSWHGEFHNKKKNGELYWESASISSIKDVNGKISHYLAVKKDITREREAQIALTKSETRLLEAQKAGHIGSWEFDVANNTYFWSEENYLILGLDPEKTVPNYDLYRNTVHPDDRELVHSSYIESVKNKNSYTCSHRLLLSDGTLKHVLESVKHDFDNKGIHLYSTGIMQDISEIVEAKNKVEESLKDKEVLLRELYHRTKNNMQIITGLFKLRSRETDMIEVQQVFTEMENRIQAMSMVHEKLYQSKNLSSINIGEYFQDLIDYIKDSYNLNYRKITIKMNFENVSVLIDTATPLGLIFNELISNAIKHAFPGNRGGEINISVKKTEEEEIILSVSDNGVGFPDNYNFRESASLGIQTILALGERQLGGSVQMEDNSGVACKITFKDNIYTPRV